MQTDVVMKIPTVPQVHDRLSPDRVPLLEDRIVRASSRVHFFDGFNSDVKLGF